MVIEETYVLDAYEISHDFADFLLYNLSLGFGIIKNSTEDWLPELMSCSEERNTDAFDVPSMNSPFTETLDGVAYYVQELADEPASGAKTMSYWKGAEAFIDGYVVEEHRANATRVAPIVFTVPSNISDNITNVTGDEEENRRLAGFFSYNYEMNIPLGSVIPGFPDIFWRITQSPYNYNHLCWSMTVYKQSNSDWTKRFEGRRTGWGAAGTISWGRWCTPDVAGAFTVTGSAAIWYAFQQYWGWKHKGEIKGILCHFELGAALSIHFWQHRFEWKEWGRKTPNCPKLSWPVRRLESDELFKLDNPDNYEGLVEDYPDDEEVSDVDLEVEVDQDQDIAKSDRQLYGPTLATIAYHCPKCVEQSTRRRTSRRRRGTPDWWSGHRRRLPPYIQRSRMCKMDAVRYDFTIYATGEIDIFGTFGASMTGHLRFRMGPMAVGAGQLEFLDRKLDSRLIIDGQFSACIRFLFFRPCWHIRKDLANINIG